MNYLIDVHQGNWKGGLFFVKESNAKLVGTDKQLSGFADLKGNDFHIIKQIDDMIFRNTTRLITKEGSEKTPNDFIKKNSPVTEMKIGESVTTYFHGSDIEIITNPKKHINSLCLSRKRGIVEKLNLNHSYVRYEDGTVLYIPHKELFKHFGYIDRFKIGAEDYYIFKDKRGKLNHWGRKYDEPCIISTWHQQLKKGKFVSTSTLNECQGCIFNNTMICKKELPCLPEERFDGNRVIWKDSTVKPKKKKKTPKTKELEGHRCTCVIDGQEVTDAKISVENGVISICQNIIEGSQIANLGYKYSWRMDSLVSDFKLITDT